MSFSICYVLKYKNIKEIIYSNSFVFLKQGCLSLLTIFSAFSCHGVYIYILVELWKYKTLYRMTQTRMHEQIFTEEQLDNVICFCFFKENSFIFFFLTNSDNLSFCVWMHKMPYIPYTSIEKKHESGKFSIWAKLKHCLYWILIQQTREFKFMQPWYVQYIDLNSNPDWPSMNISLKLKTYCWDAQVGINFRNVDEKPMCIKNSVLREKVICVYNVNI